MRKSPNHQSPNHFWDYSTIITMRTKYGMCSHQHKWICLVLSKNPKPVIGVPGYVRSFASIAEVRRLVHQILRDACPEFRLADEFERRGPDP